MPYLKTLKKIPYQKTLPRILKRCLIMFKKAPCPKKQQQKNIKNLKSYLFKEPN